MGVCNKIHRSLSDKVSVMSFLCACMVVFFHATPLSDTGTVNWWFFHLFGREGVCSIAVPYFFACSGYFLAGHFGEVGYWGREVSKRIRSLVVPYFIWMLVGMIFGLCVAYAKNRFLHADIQNEFLVLPMWEKVILYAGLHPFKDVGFLWYVRTLFLFVLASPAIFFFLRWPKLTLCALGVVHLVIVYMCYGILSIEMYFLLDRFVSVRGLLYFFAGAALRVGGHDFDKTRMPIWAGWMIFGIGFVLLVMKNLMLLDSMVGAGELVAAISVPLIIVGVWGVMPTWEWMRRLSRYSFPVFLMHNIFLSTVPFLFILCGLQEIANFQIGFSLMRTICAIGGAIFVAFVIKRELPQVGQCLFGGR